jgi:hypothetical protein
VAGATVAEYERAIAAQRRERDLAGEQARTGEQDLRRPEAKAAGQC